jgi:hypothetical protein
MHSRLFEGSKESEKQEFLDAQINAIESYLVRSQQNSSVKKTQAYSHDYQDFANF